MNLERQTQSSPANSQATPERTAQRSQNAPQYRTSARTHTPRNTGKSQNEKAFFPNEPHPASDNYQAHAACIVPPQAKSAKAILQERTQARRFKKIILSERTQEVSQNKPSAIRPALRPTLERRTRKAKVVDVTELQIREHFFRTRDAAAAIANRTAHVDTIVQQRWQWMPRDVALLAVGGYGRNELFPYSDIDLLILTADEKTQLAIKEPLSMFLRDLWDRGLRISQSVHTPADCNQIDSANAELAVSLLDRRLLAGNEELFRQIRDPRPDLGRNIVHLTNDRHAKFQGTIYHLEPNVKDSPGGLRDLQVLRWLAKLGAGDQDLPEGVPVLFEIRCYLHYLAGRDDNKLSFERQDEIAALSSAASPEAFDAGNIIARSATSRALPTADSIVSNPKAVRCFRNSATAHRGSPTPISPCFTEPSSSVRRRVSNLTRVT